MQFSRLLRVSEKSLRHRLPHGRGLEWVFGALLLCSGSLFAQPAALQLSLKQAVDLALAPDGNTRVKLATRG